MEITWSWKFAILVFASTRWIDELLTSESLHVQVSLRSMLDEIYIVTMWSVTNSFLLISISLDDYLLRMPNLELI